jgi:hypothetical protein
MKNKKQGKSRLKAYKRQKTIKKLVLINGLIVASLWVGVFYSIKKLNKNNFQSIIIEKTIIKR